MTGIRPKQHARMGEFHIEEAVLDVLLEGKYEGECYGAAEISKRAGVFRDGGSKAIDGVKSMNDAIVTGILIKLNLQQRVQRCAQRVTDKGKEIGGWELTDSEFEKRRDDIQTT